MAPEIERGAETAAAEQEKCPIHSSPEYLRQRKLFRQLLGPVIVVCAIASGVLGILGRVRIPPRVESTFEWETLEWHMAPEEQFSFEAANSPLEFALAWNVSWITLPSLVLTGLLAMEMGRPKKLPCATFLRHWLVVSTIIATVPASLMLSASILSCRWEAKHLAADGSVKGFPDVKPGGHFCFQIDDFTGMATVLSWATLFGLSTGVYLMRSPRVRLAICLEKQRKAERKAKDMRDVAEQAAAEAARLGRPLSPTMQTPATHTDGASAERTRPTVPVTTSPQPPQTPPPATPKPASRDPPPPYATSDNSHHVPAVGRTVMSPSSQLAMMREAREPESSEDLTFSALARPREIMDTWSTWQPRPIWIRTPLRERSLADLTSGVADARFESR